MYIYPSTESFDSESVFKEAMAEYGLDAEYLVVPNTGTEVGVVWNDEIVIVTFSGTTAGLDFWTDIQKNMQRMPDSWGPNVLVHDGFAGAWNSVSEFVIDEVEVLVDDGRKLWITGHSLGAAIATLAAFELKQVHGIPVEGVHTFGSPRPAGSRFAQIYNDIGLGNVTERWVIDGDPVPNFFDFYTLVTFNFLRGPSIHTWMYEHVGITNKIYKYWGGATPGPDFDLERDADDGEYPYVANGFFVEHLQYDDALDQLLGDEADAAMMDLMPEL